MITSIQPEAFLLAKPDLYPVCLDMPVASNLTLEEIKALPVGDQLEVLSGIWDGIAQENIQPSLTPEEKALLDLRVAREADDKGIDWETLRARILTALR